VRVASSGVRLRDLVGTAEATGRMPLGVRAAQLVGAVDLQYASVARVPRAPGSQAEAADRVIKWPPVTTVERESNRKSRLTPPFNNGTIHHPGRGPS